MSTRSSGVGLKIESDFLLADCMDYVREYGM